MASNGGVPAITYTRRLRAVALLDVAGYAAMMACDESGTHRRVNDLFALTIAPIVQGHDGRMIERVGDSLLLLFESSTAAVKCALAIQRSAADAQPGIDERDRIKLRIGVNVGDIIFDEAEIAGDDVNIAARLQERALPETVLVSAAVREQVHDKLGARFVDLGPARLKNIARPVRIFEVRPDDAPAKRPGWLLRLSRNKRGPAWIGASILVLLLGVAAWRMPHGIQSLASGGEFAPMSMAVLPCQPANPQVGADIADALTDEMTRGLAATSWLQTVSADVVSGVAGGRGAGVRDMGTLGRALRVRYLVAAKVVRGQAGLVADVDLVETGTGMSAWTARLEADPGNNTPSGLAQRAVVLLREAVYEAERKRLVQSGGSPRTAMEHKMLGDMAGEAHFISIAANQRARQHYLTALQVDPTFTPALISLAYTQLTDLDLAPGSKGDKVFIELDEMSKRVASAEPNSAPGWQLRSEVLARQWRWEAALEASDRAIKLDAGRAFAYGQRASLLIRLGRPAEALVQSDQALRLAEQRSGFALLQRCRALMALSDYKAAIAACQRSVAHEEWWLQHAYLLAAYTLTGDLASARIERDLLARLEPGFSLAKLRDWRQSDVADYHQQTDAHLVRGLRQAGIPD